MPAPPGRARRPRSATTWCSASPCWACARPSRWPNGWGWTRRASSRSARRPRARPGCWTTYCPWPNGGPSTPADRNYEGGFLTALMLKDLKLAQEAAARAGAATPMGAQAEATYALFDRLGFGGKDFSAVLEMLRGRLDALG